MSDYRLYFLGRDGHIQAAEELDCETDEAGRQSADDLSDGRAMELWAGARLVAKFPARPKA